MSTTRRRRTPAEAEAEILGAARQLLAERSVADLTVNDLMAATSLSRAAFYQYFPTIHHAILRLLSQVGGELFEMSQRWLEGSGDPEVEARAALEGLVSVFARDGHLMARVSAARAIDPEIDRAYGELIEGFISATARRIRLEQRRGRTPPLNRTETATALVLMTERYLTERLGSRPPAPTSRTIETLMTIWMATLYPEIRRSKR